MSTQMHPLHPREPLPSTPPSPPTQAPPPPTPNDGGSSKKWYTKKRFLIPSAILVLAGLASAGGDQENRNAAQTPTTVAPAEEPSPTTTVALTSTESQPATTQIETATTTAEPATTTTTTTTPPTTLPPEPVVISGSGDQVVAVTKPADFVIARVVHEGSRGNFSIWSYDDRGERIDLMVNVIGAYSGTVLVDILDGENTAAIEVSASGPWSVTYSHLADVRVEEGTSITGIGDDVFLLSDQTSGLTTGTFTVDGGGNFAVWGYTGFDRDLLVNEIGPYTGQAIVRSGTSLFAVSAENAWSIALS